MLLAHCFMRCVFLRSCVSNVFWENTFWPHPTKPGKLCRYERGKKGNFLYSIDYCTYPLLLCRSHIFYKILLLCIVSMCVCACLVDPFWNTTPTLHCVYTYIYFTRDSYQTHHTISYETKKKQEFCKHFCRIFNFINNQPILILPWHFHQITSNTFLWTSGKFWKINAKSSSWIYFTIFIVWCETFIKNFFSFMSEKNVIFEI